MKDNQLFSTEGKIIPKKAYPTIATNHTIAQDAKQIKARFLGKLISFLFSGLGSDIRTSTFTSKKSAICFST